jgi:hypothetical protein
MTSNFLQMDREWMYVGNRVSQHFIEGLETFLETATEYKKPENMSDVHYICCSCVDFFCERGGDFIRKASQYIPKFQKGPWKVRK